MNQKMMHNSQKLLGHLPFHIKQQHIFFNGFFHLYYLIVA